MPKYYLDIDEKYAEEKTTIFRQERKILNQHIFVDNIWKDSKERTIAVNQYFKQVFIPILEELSRYRKNSVTTMLCAEIFTSLKVHNLQSIFVLFRTFLVAFVLEQRTYSKTQQQKKLSSFQTTILEVEKILKETNHFKYGDFQYKIDWYYENQKNISYKDIDIIFNSSGKKMTNENMVKEYKSVINYSNKLAHAEVRFNSNNDKEAVKMEVMAKQVISITISLCSNIIRWKIIVEKSLN